MLFGSTAYAQLIPTLNPQVFTDITSGAQVNVGYRGYAPVVGLWQNLTAAQLQTAYPAAKFPAGTLGWSSDQYVVYDNGSAWTQFTGGGGVSTLSVVSANGLSGTVANPTTTPAITLVPTFTGIAYSNGSGLAAAIAANFPTLNQNTTGNAATATALANTPSQCGANAVTTGIQVSGASNCMSLSAYLASPPGIGITVPGIVNASSITDTGITGSTQCVHANSSGLLSGTGADCGAGGGGTPANPTATVGATPVNGSATTYMRSDAAPALSPISPGNVMCNYGSAAAGAIGCPTSTVRYSTSTTLTIASTDNGGVISQNAGTSPVAATVGQTNTTTFPQGSYQVVINNTGTATITITPTSSTINGLATATIPGLTAALLVADNSTSPGNYLLVPLSGASGGSGTAIFGSIAIPCSGDTSGNTDTGAIQAALNNLSYVSTATNNVYLGGCTYYINAALTIPNAAGFNIHGTSREGTIINQVSNNTPIFEFIGNNNNNNFDIGNMTLQWSNNQTFTQTNSICFWFNGGASYQAFNFTIHHFQMVNGYRGISQNATSPVWGMTLSDGITQPAMVGAIVSLANAVVGQPNETIRNVYISAYGGVSTAANEPVIQIYNVDNLLMEAVEFNNGSYSSSVPQIDVQGGEYATLLNVKAEFVYLAGSTSTTGGGAASLWRFINENVVAMGVKSLSANITGGTNGTPVYAAFLGVGAITYGQLSVNGISWQEQGNYATYLPYTQAYSSGNTLNVMSFENAQSGATGTNGYAPVDVAYAIATPALAPRVFPDAYTPDTVQFLGDASITLTTLSARRVINATTLTANRTITLPTCTAQTQHFDIVRKAATPGSFTLTTTDPVSGFSEVLASGTNGFNHWDCVNKAGTYEWFPTGSGTL